MEMYYKIVFAIKIISFVILPSSFSFLAFIAITKYKFTKKGNQIKQSLPENAKGVIFGLHKKKAVYSPTDAEGHIAVFGGSGLGKTTALLIPTLRNWTGTSFTIDISRDICTHVDIPHKLIYEPSNPESIPYNVFGTIDRISCEKEQNEALEQLALLMMPDNDQMTDAAKFFHTEGRKILTASLIAFYHKGFDFIPICEKIVSSSWKDLFYEIDQIQNPTAIQYINSFAGASEQNTAGCKQSTDSILKLFATNARIKHSIRRPKENELAFEPKMLESYNVFVVIDDSRLKLYSPLMHLITAQSLEYFSTRSNDNNTPILFCLDEFASLGKLEITDALRKLRKKHVRIMILTQSMADIDLIYGHDERMAMMNNYRFKIVLGADDTDTQEYFSKLIGYKKTKRYSISISQTNTTRTECEVKELIIEPADLARLGKKLILLHPDGYMQLDKNYYYKNR